jgi:metal-responsive CopG/Arc/MetJ family transcriptional regulator
MPKMAISAKLDQILLAQVDKLARELKIPRNRALAEGLRLWVSSKSKEILANKMKQASIATRKESLSISKEWEPTLLDGLNKIHEKG